MEQYIYIIAPTAGWAVAQGLKVLFDLRRDGFQLLDALASGGMPSSHSAASAALATVIGVTQGIESVYFGLALTLAAVIMYDSLGVRRTTGENTLSIRALESKAGIKSKQRVHFGTKGHTPIEVVAGGFAGLLVGVILTILL